MFMTLRVRLLASYTFILILTLFVISVALFFVLRVPVASNDEITLRLADRLQFVSGQRDLIHPTDKLIRFLTAPLKAISVHALTTDTNGVVNFDWADALKKPVSSDPADTAKKSPFIDKTPHTSLDGRIDGGPLPLKRGTIIDSTGASWLVVGVVPDDSAPKQMILLAAREPHSLSLTEIIQSYGEEILLPLLEAGGIGLIVAFVLALIVSRSVSRPLQDVSQTAAAIAEGRLDQRAMVRGPLEVRTVAEAINGMAAEVSGTQQAQRDFMANVTHDLRTPLTSIQGFSQAIIDGVASDPAAAQRAAQIIYDEAGRLNRMVQELLDLVRIEAGRFRMTRHNIRLHDVLNSVGERLAPRAAEKGVLFAIDIPPLPMIAGDGDRLVQVYTNLLDNAIKHTPDDGKVGLFAAPKDGGVLTQVFDSGEGIPAEDLPHIFDRFYQVDKSRQSSQRDGAGLGLTITKQIVEAHGGKIWVESTEGKGTTFSIWFPALASDSTTIIRRRPSSKIPIPKPVPDR